MSLREQLKYYWVKLYWMSQNRTWSNDNLDKNKLSASKSNLAKIIDELCNRNEQILREYFVKSWEDFAENVANRGYLNICLDTFLYFMD